MKIVYCSKTGHTEKYAKMLGEIYKIKPISIENYKTEKDKIVFLGWIKAGKIEGYNKIKNSNIICTIAVGLSLDSKNNTESIIKTNNIKEKFFYLQGGLDYSKTKGLMRFVYKTAGKIMMKKGDEKNKKYYEVFVNGGNFIKKENLKDITNYLDKK